MTVNQRLKQWRTSKGFTQSEVGQVIGISKQGMYAVEKGKSKLSIDQIAKLCDHYDIDLSWLMNGVGADDGNPEEKKEIDYLKRINELLEARLNEVNEQLEVYKKKIKEMDKADR